MNDSERGGRGGGGEGGTPSAEGHESRDGGIRDAWDAWNALGFRPPRVAWDDPGRDPDQEEGADGAFPGPAGTFPHEPLPGAPDLPASWSVAREVPGSDENFGAGRLVRLYTLTGGRTRATQEVPDLDLIAQISATDSATDSADRRAEGGGVADPGARRPAREALRALNPREVREAPEDEEDSSAGHSPEHERILALTRRQPLSVAELAAECDLPVGVVRILLGDLLAAQQVRVSRPVAPAHLPDEHILREVINGLRAL